MLATSRIANALAAQPCRVHVIISPGQLKFSLEKILSVDAYIENLFSGEHFRALVSSSEITSPIASNDSELIEKLYERGYKVIPFPGCITDIEKYKRWHCGEAKVSHHSACEGFGMAMRLYDPTSEIVVAVNNFLASDEFNLSIADKFQRVHCRRRDTEVSGWV